MTDLDDKNNYSVEQYERVRGLALELKEMQIRGDFPVDEFLPILKKYCLSAKNAEINEKVGPTKAAILQHFANNFIEILELSEWPTFNFLTNFIHDLEMMVVEDLDEF